MNQAINSCLKVEDVRAVIEIWNVMFSEQTRGEKQLSLLAKAYHSRLVTNGVTPKQLTFLAGKVTDACTFFPKIADILKARSTYGASQPGLTPALQVADTSSEHDLTPEEIDKNLERLKIMGQVVTGEITPEEGEQMQEELNQKTHLVDVYGLLGNEN